MEKIDGLDLEAIISTVSTQILDDKTKSVAGIIKAMILKAEQLSKDISNLDKEKIRKEKSLQDTLDAIDKAKSGDWSVLKEINNKPEETVV